MCALEDMNGIIGQVLQDKSKHEVRHIPLHPSPSPPTTTEAYEHCEKVLSFSQHTTRLLESFGIAKRAPSVHATLAH